MARTLARQIQDAEEDVDRAHRLYESAGSSHPKMKARLAQKYEDALSRLEELERECAREARQAPPSVTRDDATALRVLTQDVRSLWEAPTTTNEDRKRLLRIVLSEVIVVAVTAQRIELDLVWAGGLRQRLEVPRPKAIDSMVLRLHREGLNPQTIAQRLNAEGLTTAKGTPFQRSTIYAVLGRHGLRRKDEKRGARRPSADGDRRYDADVDVDAPDR